MAYMDFRGLDAGDTFAPARAAPIARTDVPADFTPLEWTVVSLARHDRPGSAQAGPVGRLIELLFGDVPARPLADPRLEALRRVSIPLWRRRFIARDEVAAFHAQGFTPAQLDLVIASIGASLATAA